MLDDALFMGKGKFVWWFGTVEDIGDPHGLGRVKVRILGFHNPDSTQIPTAALPWAYPIMPVTNSGIAGIGHSCNGMQINTRVFGFFMDGEMGQQPVVLGTLQGTTIQQTYKAIPYGSPMPQPVADQLYQPSVTQREGDCPDGYDASTSTTDEVIPDPRTVKANTSEWVCPTTGFIASAYGERSGQHHGVDICPAGFYQQTDPGAPHLNGRVRGPVGQPVYAAAAGKVIKIWTNNIGQGGAHTTYDINGQGSRSYGNAIAIAHNLSDGPYVTIYAHLGTQQDPANSAPGDGILVTQGQTVSAGQQIGTMGRTHNRDTLTHLHFEIRVGTNLPKSSNHINPGRIFPQMAHRHQEWLSWPSHPRPYTDIVPFKLADCPIIQNAGPVAV